MPLCSRSTTIDDLDLIAEWESDPDTRRWLGDTGRRWHERALADPTQDSLFAVDCGESVGFAVFARLDEKEVELRRIVVAPERRGVGLGRALLRAMVDHALTGYHADAVWLDVKRDNVRARKFYEAAGFEVIRSLGDERPNSDGTTCGLLHMSLSETALNAVSPCEPSPRPSPASWTPSPAYQAAARYR